MKSKEPWRREPLPKEIEAEMAAEPAPTPAQRAQYRWLIDELTRSLAPQKPAAAEAVMDLSGKVLNWLAGVVERLSFDLQPAPALARGATAKSADKPKVLGGVSKSAGPARISVLLVQGQQALEIEVDALDSAGGPLRPMTVIVRDLQGQELARAQDVPAGGVARFPGPSAGQYVFDVTFPGGRDSLTLELQDA